jgi:hypothetical protein
VSTCCMAWGTGMLTTGAGHGGKYSEMQIIVVFESALMMMSPEWMNPCLALYNILEQC